MKLFTDINKGEIKTALNSAPIRLLRFYRGNILPLDLVLVDGNSIVTSSTLSSTLSLRLAIAGFVRGSSPLIEQDLFPLTGETATGTVDLTATALGDYFNNYVPASAAQWIFKMEIEAVNASGSFRQSYYSGQIIICREIIPFSVHAPQAITDNSGTSITDNAGNAVTSN